MPDKPTQPVNDASVVITVFGRSLCVKRSASIDLAALFAAQVAFVKDRIGWDVERIRNIWSTWEHCINIVHRFTSIQQVAAAEPHCGLSGGIAGTNKVGEQVIPIVLLRRYMERYHVSVRVSEAFVAGDKERLEGGTGVNCWKAVRRQSRQQAVYLGP